MTTTTLPSGTDYEDRMTSATVNSVTTTFAYRGDGLRNSRTTGGNTTTFTWDLVGGLPVVLDDGSHYVYGAGLVSQISGANTYYYLADGLGSTMKTVDATGTVVNGYTYDVYGKKTSSTGSQVNEFDFAGQQTDATGLQYLRARYMDPETGTFVSREPMAVRPVWRGNPFAYGAGNPTRYLDPTGLFLTEEGGGANACRHECSVDFDFEGGDWEQDGGVFSWQDVLRRFCAASPACSVTWLVTLPSITGEYKPLDVEMSQRAKDSFKSRPWSVEEFDHVKRLGKRFVDKEGHDVSVFQRSDGTYQWIVQDSKSGKVWSLRKGEDEVGLRLAREAYEWK